MAKIKVDMTGVESYSRCDEGEHIVTIGSAELKDTTNGDDMVVVRFDVTAGPSKGSRVFENFPLMDNARWKLKNLLDAIGMKSDGKLVIDTDKLLNKKLIISVTHEEYKGTPKARIDQFKKLSSKAADADDEDEDEDEDEAPAPKKAVAKKPEPKPVPKKKHVPEPEEDDEDEEEEEAPAPKRSKKPEPKPLPKKKAPVVEDDEEDEDEDEEEAPPPKRKTKAPEVKPAKKPLPKKKPVDDDDDEEWDEED